MQVEPEQLHKRKKISEKKTYWFLMNTSFSSLTLIYYVYLICVQQDENSSHMPESWKSYFLVIWQVNNLCVVAIDCLESIGQ